MTITHEAIAVETAAHHQADNGKGWWTRCQNPPDGQLLCERPRGFATWPHGAASTQNQALPAILFLYEHVLAQPLDHIEGVVRSRRPKRLPVVLTVDEASRVIAHLTGDKWLIAMLLYGGGLRLLEALRLRVKDLDFERGEITVR